MSFEQQKKDTLSRIDKSKKGSVDKEIASLINKINKSNNYYTTSSCAGRIIIISRRSTKKDQGWLLAVHKKTTFEEVKKALKNIDKYPIWFKFEPFILHVTAKNIESAQELVNKARDVGFRRTGIQSTKRINIEINSTEVISTIIAEKGKLLVDDNYIKILIREANKKLKENREKIKKFFNLI